MHRKWRGVGIVGSLLFLFSGNATAGGTERSGLRYYREYDRSQDLAALIVCGDEDNPARGYRAAIAVATDPDGKGRRYLKDGTCWQFTGEAPAYLDGYGTMAIGTKGSYFVGRAGIGDAPTGFVLVPRHDIVS